jgi:2-keto-4-pentenoate hydratase/2-oxohepta-3-ene-1,7-dioic acid hydratase in catechol pathway
MKLARYRMEGSGESLGIVLDANGSEILLDVGAATLARSAAGEIPTSMMDLIAAQDRGLDVMRELLAWTASRSDPAWVRQPDAVAWLTPVPARSCIAAGRNFGKHRAESALANPVAGAQFQIDFPTGFIKLGRNLVAHRAEVKRPEDVLQFDYEVEIAVIVGQPIERVSVAQARQAIFGYTVFNDLSAREWQLGEMKNQLVMMGKNFPGFGPIGPCILTADEVPDPAALTLWLKVNGELRQHSDCSDLIFGFDELVSFWSRVGLEPGDIICTGTPDGVALHRKPDPMPFYLKPGDVVHAGVDQIGVLETRIV